MAHYISLKSTIVAFVMGFSACDDGYVGICAKVIEEQRDKFRAVCVSRSGETLRDGTLDSVVQRRDELLKYNDCQLHCEKWICVQEGDEIYVMRTNTFRTCGH